MSAESDYVTLISSDGYSFVVQRSSACISAAIRRMLDPSRTPPPLPQDPAPKRTLTNTLSTVGFAESKTNTCRFENIK